MYLCHKCGGVLAYSEEEDISGLLDCCCISGYLRGFEKYVTREQAIAQQIKEKQDLLALYIRQERGQNYLDPVRKQIEKLSALA